MTEPKAPRNVTRRWLGAAGAGALLTSLAASASTVAFQQEGEINHALGVSESGTGYGGTEFTADGSLSDQGFNNYITAAYEFCEREEEEGSVLLYNKDNALPLAAEERNVTAFGRGSIDPVFRSTAGGSSTNKDFQKTPVDALKDAGFNVNETMLDAYANAAEPAGRTVSNVGEFDASVLSDDVKGSFSGYGDVAFVTLSRFATEGQDLDM